MNRIRDNVIMWRLIILAYSTVTYAQNSRRPEYDNGHGWDIRLAVPGKPGTDYPTLNSIPRTSFSCSGKSPGYYTDVEAGCQVFRVCTLGATYGFQSFLCPNGTLFNQEVLVCDWWMSVRCEQSRLLFNNNSNKFGNLKLGPELMKDIKKMLTHPMRNPYDKTVMKSNYIVMQDYKPPSGQIFPNGALISGPDRPPNNVYVPAKQKQGNFAQNLIQDLSFAASTPSSQYIPSSFNVARPTVSRDIEILQPKFENLQHVQNSHPDRTSHRQKGHLARIENTDNINNNRIAQSQSYTNTRDQNQRNIPQTQFNSQNIQNSQPQHQQPQYVHNVKPSNQIKKHNDFGNNNANQHYSYNLKQNGHQLSRIVNGYISREPKQDLLNSYIAPPTGKTLKFSRIVQKSSTGSPKSKVIFKTWIVRPSKSAQLTSAPSSYTYNRPSNHPSENRLIDSTTTPRTEKINPDSEDVSYIYNRPTPSNKQIITTVKNTQSIYLPPTAPTFSNRLKISQSSKVSRPYIAPTTYKPLSKLYVPPSENTLELSRQYLNPNLPSQNTAEESARLLANPTPPEFDFITVIPDNKVNPSFSLTKQSHINTNQNNLTFSDILTKEKLDITVSDIVKDTNKFLKTVPPELFNRYSQNEEVVQSPTKNYIPPEFENVSEENVTAQPLNPTTKSEKIIAPPSTVLEPPIDISFENHENSNKLTNLPFFQESVVPTNTIERTVSLKITIPETIAEYLFNNQNENDAENLEILNTGSSNYLVLSNNNEVENNGHGLIPIAKLIWDKNANISNSQALAYSFLADSINAAKEYSNIAKQNVISSTPAQLKFQNINNENLEEITTKISQLTSSHYSKNNQNSANTVDITQKNLKKIPETSHDKYTTGPSQQHFKQNHQDDIVSRQNLPDQLYSSPLQAASSNNLQENLQNSNKIYSGQLYKLPVPEVTRQIYNSPNPSQTSDARLTNDLAQIYSERKVSPQTNSNNDRSNAEVDIIQSEAVPYPPARQQLPRTKESTFNSREQSGNIVVDNFLSPETGITAQVQDNIFGTLPHPLEENKLVTYKKNKSYYLYTKVEDDTDDFHTSNTINHDQNTQRNSKLTRSNDQRNQVSFELFPSIGYELESENEKQILLNALKINEFHANQNDKINNHNNQKQELVSGIDFTILHPSSKKQTELLNNDNTLLYRGPSSYFAPQSSVGSLGRNSQLKSNSNSRIEQLDDNDSNGYSKTIPARQFSF